MKAIPFLLCISIITWTVFDGVFSTLALLMIPFIVLALVMGALIWMEETASANAIAKSEQTSD